MSLGQLTTATFLTCTSVPQATMTYTETYTTTYTTVLLNACPTSSWSETYTVVATCTGNPTDYTTPAIPHNFVVTTIVCDVCDPKTLDITCPAPTPTTNANILVDGTLYTPAPTAAGDANGDDNVVGSQPGVSESDSAPRPYATAAAPSLKRSLGLLSAVAVVAIPFFVG